MESSVVITDSGGIQEETSYLKIPCITLRKNTERPVTMELGSNILVPDLSQVDFLSLLSEHLSKDFSNISIPFWDGKTAGRIVDIISREFV
jgi:UDP-N-acetylglucosamine 2-epimerase (non-hydrolysing)